MQSRAASAGSPSWSDVPSSESVGSEQCVRRPRAARLMSARVRRSLATRVCQLQS
jgi:hypothetical protein